MNVRKFVSANARDALRKVKETLGPDAIILSNRGVPGGVEIMAVAARDMAMLVPNAGHDERGSEPGIRSTLSDDDFQVSLSRGGMAGAEPRVETVDWYAHSAKVLEQDQPKEAPKPSTTAGIKPDQLPRFGARNDALAPRRPAAPRAAPEQPKPQQAEVIPAGVMDEIRSLRSLVEQHLAGLAWNETARTAPARNELLRQMLDAGFSPKLSRTLVAKLPPELEGAQALNWVQKMADRALNTIDAQSDIVDRGGVYALVGPTGVGKTTTTAKLAARCVLKYGPGRVALITTDSYRIGAHEQLRIYGRILGVPVYLVKDALELRQTLLELSSKHMVLIDTMGMSQKDKLVPELTGMLEGCRVSRLLLMSATSKGDTMDDIVHAYQGSGLAGCVLTKIDEAASLATSLDAVMRHGLTLHYVSNGQRVPEDLHLPNRTYLLHRAFKDVPEASAHRHQGNEPALVLANGAARSAGAGRG